MISMAKDIYAEKGELTNDDYIAVATRYDYGGDTPEKYLLNIREAVEHYLEV